MRSLLNPIFDSVTTDSAVINNVLDATGLTLSSDPTNTTRFITAEDGGGKIGFEGVEKNDVAGDNSAVTISGPPFARGAFFIVQAKSEGSVGTFTDYLTYQGRGSSVTVVHSEEFNTPGTRSYSVNAGDVQLAIDQSGATYNVGAIAISSSGDV